MNLPIREAFIVPGPGDVGRAVAGVPLLVRTILVLQRAGIERCTLVGAAAPVDSRIRCRVETASALVAPADPALRLVVGPGTVIDRALVDDLQRRARAGETIELESDGARVRVAPGPRVIGNGVARVAPQAGTLRPVDAAALEHTLLRGLENPRDGYLDGLINRRLSRPLSRVLLRTPLSPNAVTVVGIAVGICGGLLVGAPTTGGVILGIALLILSGVLDCCDGELARLRFAESKLGHWLDVTGDTVVHLALLGGVALRIWPTGALPGWGTLGLLLFGALAAFAVISWSEETEERRHRVDAWENGFLDGVLSKLTTRDWHVFVVAFAVAGRLDLLVPAGAVGAQVFWLLVLVLLLRVLRRAPTA
jgi:phosphatidylglycerophosphate synthase